MNVRSIFLIGECEIWGLSCDLCKEGLIGSVMTELVNKILWQWVGGEIEYHISPIDLDLKDGMKT